MTTIAHTAIPVNVVAVSSVLVADAYSREFLIDARAPS
jgi:hypothetical protein